MTKRMNIAIEPLALHPEALPVLAAWVEAEWPEWSMTGKGDAKRDLRSFLNRGSLPVGLVALREGVVCGVAVLKGESIGSHQHLSPWAPASSIRLCGGRGAASSSCALLELRPRRFISRASIAGPARRTRCCGAHVGGIMNFGSTMMDITTGVMRARL